MYTSLIIDDEKKDLGLLEKMLLGHCPQIAVCGKASSIPAGYRLIKEVSPDLVFSETSLCAESGISLMKQFPAGHFEMIFVTKMPGYAMEAINCCAAGYVLKPVQREELIAVIGNAKRRIDKKKEYLKSRLLMEKMIQHSTEEVIGIPTLEGFEFIPVRDIIRCEGLRRFTCVITKEKKDIISSYNLGEFRKILEAYRFFSPHKSHLINLYHIRKYHKEGSIIMLDGSYVPVAKRKKCEFLNTILHL